MRVKLFPGTFEGEVMGVSAKSYLHRMLICAANSDSDTRIRYRGLCEDVEATIDGLRVLGAKITGNDEEIVVKPIPKGHKERKASVTGQPGEKEAEGGVPVIQCKESGSTLRFLLPVAAALTSDIIFGGEGRLPERPLNELLICMKNAGKEVMEGGRLPVRLRGTVEGSNFLIPGNISSQYLTGLLLMSPLLNDDIRIGLATELKSEPYIAMTLEIMKQFGVIVKKQGQGFFIDGKQYYQSPGYMEAEGDWSNAAFFLVANAMGQKIRIPNLNQASGQGDRKVVKLIEDMRTEKNRRIDLSTVPDLVAPLAVLAAVMPGTTVFEQGGRLRYKESDRLQSTGRLIESLGGTVIGTEDGFIIEGKGLRGGCVDSFGDHRIAMAAAIASCRCSEPVEIINPMVVKKSYPHFFDEITRIGGKLTWTN